MGLNSAMLLVSCFDTSRTHFTNLTQRQSNRRLTRRTNGFAEEITGLETQLWLSLAYYHWVLPQHSLRQELPVSDEGHYPFVQGVG